MAGFTGIKPPPAVRTLFPVSRLVILWLLGSALVFAALVLAIHAFTFDRAYFSHMRTLLVADDCPQPCFLGIRPGVTTRDDAIALLQSQSDVRHVQSSPYIVFWDWDAAQSFSGSAEADSYPAWLVADREGLVRQIHLLTLIPFADTEVALGHSNQGDLSAHFVPLGAAGRVMFTQINRYPPWQMQVTGSYTCRESLWESHAELLWSDTPPIENVLRLGQVVC